MSIACCRTSLLSSSWALPYTCDMPIAPKLQKRKNVNVEVIEVDEFPPFEGETGQEGGRETHPGTFTIVESSILTV